MKFLKIMVAILVVILAIPMIIALFAPKGYAVEREVTINKPTPEVFEYLKHLKNQDDYSPWASRDPNMKKEFRGTDGTVGFVAAWDSDHKEVGKGEQEIKKITDNERIDFELRFIEPFEATEPAYLATEPTGEEETLVKWGFSGKMKYPMNFMLVFMDMEEMIGNDLESGLAKMKTVLESRPSPEALEPMMGTMAATEE